MTKKLFFYLVLFIPVFSFCQEKVFLNIKSTPERWHERSIEFLNQIEWKFKNGEFISTFDSCVYYESKANMYANLGESADTVFKYLDKSLSISRHYGCFILDSHESVMKNSKNGMYFGKLDSTRYFKRLIPCQIYLQKIENEEIQKIKKDSTYDQKMIRKIEKMHDEDQRYRAIDRMDLQYNYDQKNQILLDSIFKNYGFPGKSKVSSKYSSFLITIYLHTEIEFQEKWLPLLIENLKKKELSPGDLSFVLDRIHTFKYQKQFFGSQRLYDAKGKMEKVEIYTETEKKKIFDELGISEYFK